MDKILSPIKKRLLDFIEDKGITKASFLLRTGIAASNLKGPGLYSEIGGDKIAKILSEYPELNPEWLVTGENTMLRTLNQNNNPLTMVTETNGQLVKTTSNSKIKRTRPSNQLINFYDVDFAAGDINFFDDNYAIKPAYTMDIPEFNGCTAFRTYNNSMEKLIYSGDILFATKENDWQNHIEYGQIFGIVCNNARKYLKYIRKADGKESTHFLLKSENTDEYDDFLLEKHKIKSIWLIHGWLKKRVG